MEHQKFENFCHEELKVDPWKDEFSGLDWDVLNPPLTPFNYWTKSKTGSSMQRARSLRSRSTKHLATLLN